MKLLFVTSNRHKYNEVKELLAPFGIEVLQAHLDFHEPGHLSQKEIAAYKAEQAFREFGKPVIAEDTAVYFDAYHDFPGHLAKRIYNAIGFRGLMALVRSAKNRKAYFRAVIAYCNGKGAPKIFSGEMHGMLLEKLRLPKADKLPYEKIFVPEGLKKAVVELTLEEKNRISHRALAARKLGKWLSRRR